MIAADWIPVAAHGENVPIKKKTFIPTTNLHYMSYFSVSLLEGKCRNPEKGKKKFASENKFAREACSPHVRHSPHMFISACTLY